jgi:hypothetical protein
VQPIVRVFEKRVLPGSRARLGFTVSDNSGRARAHAVLYDVGVVLSSTVSGFGPTNGPRWYWNALIPGDVAGPLFLCVWADDAAGNVSRDVSPDELDRFNGSCAWLSTVIRVEQVANGCGGGGWDAMVVGQNYFGNEHTYSNSNINPLAKSYPVNFVEACNVHDAAYGGYTVHDVLNDDVVRDFRTWSRPQVDRKFLKDMRKICLTKIPESATVARENCMGRGGNASFGAESLYNFVHKFGFHFFDADLTRPGPQQTGHRPNF